MTTPKQETTPDQLMEAFHGRSFKSVILFTLIVHVVVSVRTCRTVKSDVGLRVFACARGMRRSGAGCDQR